MTNFKAVKRLVIYPGRVTHTVGNWANITQPSGYVGLYYIYRLKFRASS